VAAVFTCRYPGRLDDADYDNTNFLPPESMNADQLHNWFGEQACPGLRVSIAAHEPFLLTTCKGLHLLLQMHSAPPGCLPHGVIILSNA
jgi:hypothetical protein